MSRMSNIPDSCPDDDYAPWNATEEGLAPCSQCGCECETREMFEIIRRKRLVMVCEDCAEDDFDNNSDRDMEAV